MRPRTLAPAMPLPPHVLLGTERSRRGRFDGNRFTRWLHRPDRRAAAVAATPAAEHRRGRSSCRADPGRRRHPRILGRQRDRQRHLAARGRARRCARARTRSARVAATGKPGIQRGALRRTDAREPVSARLLAAERGLPAQLGLTRSLRRGAGSFRDAPPARREREGGPLPSRMDRDVTRQDLSRRRGARRRI